MKNEKEYGDGKISSPFLKKLDNYWYHYKWHTIISLFLVVVILICSFQMFKKDEYDLEVLYAGPSTLLNDRQTILDIEAAFADLLSDQTGDGKVSVNLVSYWVDDRVAENSDLSAGDINYLFTNSQNNKRAYTDEVKAGNLSIFLVSPELFHMVDDEAGFMRVVDIFPELEAYQEEVCVYDEDGDINRFGVVLSKTAFGQRAGLSSLPEDTILCIRKKSVMAGWFGAARAKKNHELAQTVFYNALSLGKKE